MPKKKLFSDVSQAKLAEALMANYAGRIGGVIGLDRDVQLKLMNMADSKADWWRTKFSVYHQLRVSVADVIRSANPNFPNYLYGLAYAYAQKVAKAYAMYPADVADGYLLVIKSEFEDLLGLLGNETVARIDDLAREAGQRLYSLYRLGGQPPAGAPA